MTDKLLIEAPARELYKICDGLGTTRAHQNAASAEAALIQYGVSVDVPSKRLQAAGWRAVRADALKDTSVSLDSSWAVLRGLDGVFEIHFWPCESKEDAAKRAEQLAHEPGGFSWQAARIRVIDTILHTFETLEML